MIKTVLKAVIITIHPGVMFVMKEKNFAEMIVISSEKLKYWIPDPGSVTNPILILYLSLFLYKPSDDYEG